MAKLKFTGDAFGTVTYQNKYEVTTGSVIDAEDGDVNALLQTGLFQPVEEEKKPSKEEKKSDDTGKDSSKK